MIEFAYKNNYHSCIQMASYEALYGHRCRYPFGWFEVGEASVRRRECVLKVDDCVFLKMSPMKGVMRFGIKGKLSLRYIGTYKILKMIIKVEYE